MHSRSPNQNTMKAAAVTGNRIRTFTGLPSGTGTMSPTMTGCQELRVLEPANVRSRRRTLKCLPFTVPMEGFLGASRARTSSS